MVKLYGMCGLIMGDVLESTEPMEMEYESLLKTTKVHLPNYKASYLLSLNQGKPIEVSFA
ncbi:hypothetical protein AT240_01960 [Bartonella henselae]|nr:hypothetical protein AT240_01960 [Bartonella henselae]